MKRRFFLFAAPAIVASASLMKLSVLAPEPLVEYWAGADDMYVMIGKKRMFWNGTLWEPAPEGMQSWRDHIVDNIRSYTPDAEATDLERRMLATKTADYAKIPPPLPPATVLFAHTKDEYAELAPIAHDTKTLLIGPGSKYLKERIPLES